jgi:hypothetical protein
MPAPNASEQVRGHFPGFEQGRQGAPKVDLLGRYCRVARGLSAPGSHRSVRKPLGLYGSCHPDHQTLGTEGTHPQCANMRGNRSTIPRQHRKAFFFARNRLYFLRIQRTR